jgi:RNA polymerase sigma-70 factor (ECF subfamily)
MYRAAKAVIGRPADAEDVIQNLFLKFVQKEFGSEVRANPRGYLYRAAVNASLNLIRSCDRRKETDGVDELEIPEAASERVNDNVRERLTQWLRGLDLNVLEVVLLHHECGFTDAEIAQVFGHSRSRIASILSRARAQLKKTLGSPGGEKNTGAAAKPKSARTASRSHIERPNP